MKIRSNIFIVFLMWIIVLFYLTFMFSLSAQSGAISHNTSRSIVNSLKEFKNDFYTKKTNKNNNSVLWPIQYKQYIYDNYLRKLAHSVEYFILSLLLYFALLFSKLYKNIVYVYILIISTIIAATDEIHQIFVPGRTALVSDVFIDLSGAFSFIIINMLISRLIHKKVTSID